jgi:alpha-L-fucosidase
MRQNRAETAGGGKSADERDRRRRMKWWHEARFGMFVHYGLYALLGRGECVMYWERIAAEEYAKLARRFRPQPGAARAWASLAKKAGMKYMMLTAKHGDGYCLWDTEQTEFNAARTGPKRDLVREYVEACREFGLRVGIYFNLNDWRHPDCARALRDPRARRRYLDFVQGCVRELMTDYGRIDVLWYDFPAALQTTEQWESRKMNTMVRGLQPEIVINDRSKLPEDFGTPEGHISAQPAGRAWESCMTFTGQGIWGWRWEPEEDWASARDIIEMVRQVTAGGGNLLLNVGPLPDGSVPAACRERLRQVGKWLKGNEQAVYGQVDRVGHENFHPWIPYGNWTRRGKAAYFWCRHWPGMQLVLVEVKTPVKRVSFLKTGKAVEFRQDPKGGTLVLAGLPKADPDKVAHTTVFKVEFQRVPRRKPEDWYTLVWCGQ